MARLQELDRQSQDLVMSHLYFAVISPGPAIMVRVPARRLKCGEYQNVPRWASIMKALTPVMHAHQLRSKDIHQVEHFYAPSDDGYDGCPKGFRLEAAYNGDPNILPTVWLYDWKGTGFRLERAPVVSST
jgi:hypothetical protein